MIEPILILIAIPLNFIGFILKHKTKLGNKLIPIVISTISIVLCFTIGLNFGLTILGSVVLFALVNGMIAAFVAMGGWDSFKGVKTFIVQMIARAYELIENDKEAKMDRLKNWHQRLLSFGLSLGVVAALTFLVGYTNLTMGNATMAAIIDTTVLAIVFTAGGLLLFDLAEKIVKKDTSLNLQYIIVFAFAAMSIGSFLVIYVAPTWEITYVSIGVFVLSTALALFLGRYSYIPSLRTEKEIIQDLMKKNWAEYENLTDEQVLERLKADVAYTFKLLKWGSEVDTAKPLFQDSENNAITTNAAIKLGRDSDKAMIKKAIEDFTTIIKTKPKTEVK